MAHTLARSSTLLLRPAHHISCNHSNTVRISAFVSSGRSLANNSASPPLAIWLKSSSVQIRTSSTPVKSATRRVQTAAMASHDLEVFGKAASGTGSPSTVRGDCPFSMRTYMDLEEKGVKYKATYIEEGENKPKWFMENNPSGLMPVLRDGDKWIQDSDKIAAYLEEQFPDPPLKAPEEVKSVGGGIFQAFTQWLQAKDANSPAKEELVKELGALNEHLKTKGPFVAGEKFTEMDCSLAPKLLHAKVALAHYYEYKFMEDFPAIKAYMDKIESRESFKNSNYPTDMIVKGWQMKFELPGKMVPQAS